MFGRNTLVKRDPEAGFHTSLRVREIFDTIQGEGPYAGRPAVFVRLAGCNLRCHFCDTDFDSVVEVFTAEQIVERVQSVASGRRDLVVLTGGEPLIQPVAKLCWLLGLAGYHIQIETAGTSWDVGLEELLYTDETITLVCSPKTGKVHPMVEKHCRNWKYILSAGDESLADGLPICSTQEKGKMSNLYRPTSARAKIWVQPCDAYSDQPGLYSDQTGLVRDVQQNARNLQHAAYIAMRYNYRLTVQIHKLIGLP